jgi:hypothetical protein
LGEFTQTAAKNISQPRSVLVQVVTLDHTGAALRAQLAAQFRIIHQSADGVGQFFNARRRDEQAVHLIANQLGDAGNKGALHQNLYEPRAECGWG